VNDSFFTVGFDVISPPISDADPVSTLRTPLGTPARSASSASASAENGVSDALAKGARLVVGGHRHALGGRFFEPTILADVTPAMLLAREETFGPVAPLFRFTTDEEAIQLANDTEFGLASYFYGRDIARVWRVAERSTTPGRTRYRSPTESPLRRW